MKGVQAHRAVVTRRHPRYYQFIVLAILLIALFFLVLGYIAGTKKTAQNIMSLVQNESAEGNGIDFDLQCPRVRGCGIENSIRC